MTQIKEHLDPLTAVLILANGTAPKITVGSDYALSMLSAIFPNAVTNNLAFLFTNVSSPLFLNFRQDTLPSILKDAPQFLIDNPIVLQKRYLKIKDSPKVKMKTAYCHEVVKTGERNALEMLVDFFDWLDSLEPQSTTDIVPLDNTPQTIPALAEVAASREAKDYDVSFHPACGWCLDICSVNDVNAFRNSQKSILAPASKERPASHHDSLCTAPDCYSTCSSQLPHVYSCKRTGQYELGRMRNNLEQTLDFLRKAKEKVRQGIQKVKRIFSVRMSK